MTTAQTVLTVLSIVFAAFVVYQLVRRQARRATAQYKVITNDNWMFNMEIPDSMDEGTALGVAQELDRVFWDAWVLCEDIYEVFPDPPRIERIRLVPASGWEDRVHPAIKMQASTRPFIHVCWPLPHGYDLYYLFAGEIHNLYRIVNGWPVYCVNDHDEARKLKCLSVLEKIREIFASDP